jgi:segregation and condensation protein B
MAFNLKKVLRALVFSTSQPLSVKDIQAVFTRFHEQASLSLGDAEEPVSEEAASALPAALPEGVVSPGASEEAPAEVPAINPLALAQEDPELYADVPSLVTATQIREAMAEIREELKASDCGLELTEGGSGFQLLTEPRFARWLRVLRNEPPPVKLSQSALETLAVISYRQPVTRTEIEHIRGVSAEAGVNKLLERELIYIVGRADLPGRPLQYGTTDKFLDFVGVKSLDELPASDVLSNRQIDDWLQKSNNAKAPSDADMGLPLELGEGDSPNFEQVSVDHEKASASSEVAASGAADILPSSPASS